MRERFVVLRVGLVACGALILCAATGCHTATPDADITHEAIRARYLSWLTDGVTGRAEVVGAFGEPTHSYEGGRITAYHLYLSDPEREVTSRNFTGVRWRGFGKLRPDTQLLAINPGAGSEVHLRKYLSPTTFGLVLVYEAEKVRAHTLLRSSL